MMRRRKIRAEGTFADAANNHGFKRSRWRGLEKMRIQNVLIATIQNARKLIRATRGPQKACATFSKAAYAALTTISSTLATILHRIKGLDRPQTTLQLCPTRL